MTERTSEAELFEDLRRDRPGAWERFVRRFLPIVYAVPRRMGLSDADAEEVTQATWIVLHRHLHWIEKPASIVSWVLTTTSREASRIQRDQRRRTDVEAIHARGAEARTEPSPEDRVARLELVFAVREAVEALGPPCSDLLAALYFSPTSEYRQVAKRLGMPLGSVGPTRQRCLERLFRKLERQDLTELLENEGT